MLENDYKEVNFLKYCKTCKYKNTKESENPCAECLEHPANLYSEIPVKWIKEEK
ncbi:MAG: hypothetical protein IKZ08_02470 [Bacteroidales bacterium]|nr:hypothetical protein [Bacteroidales bacterium]